MNRREALQAIAITGIVYDDFARIAKENEDFNYIIDSIHYKKSKKYEDVTIEFRVAPTQSGLLDYREYLSCELKQNLEDLDSENGNKNIHDNIREFVNRYYLKLEESKK